MHGKFSSIFFVRGADGFFLGGRGELQQAGDPKQFLGFLYTVILIMDSTPWDKSPKKYTTQIGRHS